MSDNTTMVVLVGIVLAAILYAAKLDTDKQERISVSQDSTALYRSLYLECNGTIKRWNEDTVSYFKNDINK